VSLRPQVLPKLRDQTLRFLDDPNSSLRQTSAHLQPSLDSLGRHLRAASLYWASPDMTALAVSAGAQLAAARWATADRPSPCGLMIFDGGVGAIDADGVSIPLEACAWGPHEGKLLVWLLLSRRRLAAEMTRTDLMLVEELIPPLVPVRGFRVPVTAEPVPMAEIDSQAPLSVVSALAAAWLLMQQPTLVERGVERPDKAEQRAYTRQGRPPPEVSIVDLRRQYTPQDRDLDAGTDGRRYRHRWVVSGHWRDQPHGPDRSLRRQQWIPAHIKGPDGAPMLAVETVNVWRR